VFFKSGEDILTPESFAEINILLVYLKARPNLRIELFGHTDNSGDEASNQLLSQKRAEAIGNYLIKKGISEIRIKAIGYGSSKPIDSNLTESGRKANRRVEFNLIEN
jgi:outer membrane protein OmpA-like peptidoglycan-associated protein